MHIDGRGDALGNFTLLSRQIYKGRYNASHSMLPTAYFIRNFSDNTSDIPVNSIFSNHFSRGGGREAKWRTVKGWQSFFLGQIYWKTKIFDLLLLQSLRFNSGMEIDWPDGSPPSDEPKCGFDGEKCTNAPNRKMEIALGVVFSLFFILLAAGVLVYRYAKDCFLFYFWRGREWEGVGGSGKKERKIEEEDGQTEDHS